MRSTLVQIVFFAAVLASPTWAATLTGNKLEQFCSSPTGSPGQLACVMYIQGFVGGIEAGDGTKVKDKRAWCFPDGSTVGQSKLVVQKYMRDNPQDLHNEAAVVVGIALVQAFPCKNSN